MSAICSDPDGNATGCFAVEASEDWDSFDALPARLRRQVANYNLAISANPVADALTARISAGTHSRIAEVQVMIWLEECESWEIREFSSQYRAATGFSSPHVAAAATVLRGAA